MRCSARAKCRPSWRPLAGVATATRSSPLTFFVRPSSHPKRACSTLGLAPCRTPTPRNHRSCLAPAQPRASLGAPTYIYDANTPRIFATPRHYAYVKIAEGCDYKCAFCIIPTLRGAYRSRPAVSIVEEARALAAQGVRNCCSHPRTTFYGIDRGRRGALGRLLRS